MTQTNSEVQSEDFFLTTYILPVVYRVSTVVKAKARTLEDDWKKGFCHVSRDTSTSIMF
jgi:hypothetical protein